MVLIVIVVASASACQWWMPIAGADMPVVYLINDLHGTACGHYGRLRSHSWR